jgi:putative oxidoreductase
MVDKDSFGESWSGRFLSILRIIAAFLYMQHGAQKLFGFFAMPQMHSFPLLSFMGLGGVLEFFGGLLVLLGLFTRPVAFILSGQMAVAYFMVHASKGFWPILNGGDLAALWSFLFLYLAAAGGGVWSLDYVLRRKGLDRTSET